MSGTSAELVIGTKVGIVRTKDVRILSEQAPRWNSDFVLGFNTAFEQYVDPLQILPERIVGAPANVEMGDLPLMPEVTAGTRRMRLLPKDYEKHGYTTGCPGCIRLRRGGAGPSRNHSDECRAKLEGELAGTSEGRARKERETARREEELTQRLSSEDERQKHEQAQKEIEESQKVEVEAKPEGEREGMDESDHVELESQPARGSEQRQGSPVKVDRTELEAGPSSSTDTRWPLQHRDPAQRRPGGPPQEFDLTPTKRPRVPEASSPTVSYNSDEQQDADMTTDRQIVSAMLRNVDLTEVFSPARVVEACRKHGLVAGDSFDLRTGYDLANETTQRHVKAQIEKSGAVLVICSPPCTNFRSCRSSTFT